MTESIPTHTDSLRAPVSFDRDDVEAAAANLAWWWRMSFSDDYSEPQCEAPWWEQAARVALNAVAQDRTRHPKGFAAMRAALAEENS